MVASDATAKTTLPRQTHAVFTDRRDKNRAPGDQVKNEQLLNRMSLSLKDSDEHISKMVADARPPEAMLQARPGDQMVQIGFQSQTTPPPLRPPMFPAVPEEIANRRPAAANARGMDEGASAST